MSRYAALTALALVACGAPQPAPADGGTDAGAPAACMPQDVKCVDESISTLDLFTNIAPGVFTEEGTAAGEFTTHVDATAGTAPGGTTPTKSYLYAKFTATGMQKVELDDQTAITSPDWDIAFRRYVIRLNSGVSGPSCVTVGRTAPGTTFDSLTSVPSLTYRTEEYFTSTCDYVSDASGIGGPATALSSWWQYGTCLKMTNNVYVIALADGRHVKVEVLRYYDTAAAQQQCQTAGTIPSPSGAANLHVRWAFLP